MMRGFDVGLLLCALLFGQRGPVLCAAFSFAVSDPLGPSDQLASLEISDPPLRAYRCLPGGEHHTFTIERVSYEPDSFLLRGFLSASECCRLMEEDIGMEQAQTATGSTSARRGCKVGWLDNTRLDGIVGSLAAAAGNILLTEKV
uniref:Uncharacterized protein n=1 Tax=Trieres chinensis TaxID=1514140 RepID=A0A7S1ZIR0_TRICV|mmetsp:Transcript_26360/g.54015  ORF Transcript_26360/g.54015 Transcript_26360/m.54015 type:complete len:145 (+) Transcript_26360:122-556(+)